MYCTGGPVLIEHLCGLLIRFHLHETALIGDIEKAFLQIGLNIPDRDVTRFIWLKNPSDPELDNNIQILHFARIPFGVISRPISPWCYYTTPPKDLQQLHS